MSHGRERARACLLVQEEIFGPVVSVTPFDDEAAAVALANDNACARARASGGWGTWRLRTRLFRRPLPPLRWHILVPLHTVTYRYIPLHAPSPSMAHPGTASSCVGAAGVKLPRA